ncbi:DinB family protein [Deinococcus aquaedulcis]|uniref:DinB family protein n=1 Tax=Deinococcus aquaedulcis TaxID=2840455 RepID=UPI001C8367DE|nr:DinB family protein [Deinococcus aquaedulcis]
MEEARRALMTQLLAAECSAFLAALRACPAALFHGQPRTGHSAAWHALHVMDWTRATVQAGLGDIDPQRTYGYLGLEDRDWIKAVTGPTRATAQDSAPTIIGAVADVFAGAQDALHTAPADRLTPKATFMALGKQRGVLDSLSYHVRHIAYHRGQIALVVRELS